MSTRDIIGDVLMIASFTAFAINLVVLKKVELQWLGFILVFAVDFYPWSNQMQAPKK